MNVYTTAEMQLTLQRHGHAGWSIKQQHHPRRVIGVYDNQQIIRWLLWIDDGTGKWLAWNGAKTVRHGNTPAAAMSNALQAQQ